MQEQDDNASDDGNLDERPSDGSGGSGSQAHRVFGPATGNVADNAAQRFREANPDDAFEGASGVLFEQAMAQTRMAICLSDPNGEDAPIVFANRAFRDLTGYEEDEIVGRNCRFLQGRDTDPKKVRKLGEALKREDVIVTEILNYRKDGTPFWNALHLGPIYDLEGKLVYYFGSQWDVTDVHAARAGEQQAKVLSRELSHRMKNMFAVIGSIVNVTGRTRGIQEETREINERIQALGRAYETTLDDASRGAVEIGPAIRSVLAPYDPQGDRIAFLDGDVMVEPTAVSTIGLTLHELATNAIKYGALSVPDGHVEIAVERDSEDAEGALSIRWTESGGPPVHAPGDEGGSGIEIIDTLLRAARGSMERDWREDGLRATLRLRARP